MNVALSAVLGSFLLLGGAGCSRASGPDDSGARPPQTTGTAALIPMKTALPREPMRLIDMLASVDRYLGKSVDVVIVESLRGPQSPEELLRTQYGQLRVEIPDGGELDLALVHATWNASDATRYMKKFDRVVNSPVRVKGTLLEDPELSRKHHRSYVIRVESMESMSEETPIHASHADIPRMDRRTVTYEGVIKHAFEVSLLDGDIWVGYSPKVKIVGRPDAGILARGTQQRVRVRGVVYARPGARYGHMGSAPYEIVATDIEYLGTP